MNLQERDYAEVRARVIREIVAGRRRRRLGLGFATAAIIAILAWPRAPQSLPVEPPKKSVSQWSAAVPTAVASTPLAAPLRTPALHSEPVRHVKPERVRIELHTHDPDIRIIWIVNPGKEES